MTEDELKLLRIDAFLAEEFEDPNEVIDMAAMQAEIDRAWLAARKSKLRLLRSELDRAQSTSVARPVNRAAVRARLAEIFANDNDVQLTLAARGGANWDDEDLELLLDDLADLLDQEEDSAG